VSSEVMHFILGAGFNLLIALVIVRYIYYPVAPHREYVFSFLAFNTVIYFVMSLLTSIELSVGVGFGLFAIFSVVNYRTEEMPIREMTYLFIIIALPVMNSIFGPGENLTKLLIANVSVVVLLHVLEQAWGFRFESRKRITYEKIELIDPANRDLLLTDLRIRTGLPVKRVHVGRIDFLRDIAEIRIFYDEPVSIAPSERDIEYVSSEEARA